MCVHMYMCMCVYVCVCVCRHRQLHTLPGLLNRRVALFVPFYDGLQITPVPFKPMLQY